MSLEGWMSLWTWVFVVMIAAFYLLVVIVAPLGRRDLKRLFADLRRPTGEARKDSDG